VGEGVGPNLAAVKFAVSSTTVTKTADSSGVATATVVGTPPAGSSWTSPRPALAPRPRPAGSGTLPSTGGDSESLLGIWVGGGALVLAGATVAVAATVRRNRQETNA
jgi:LPXTG-motif cell wall-anchored protein